MIYGVSEPAKTINTGACVQYMCIEEYTRAVYTDEYAERTCEASEDLVPLYIYAGAGFVPQFGLSGNYRGPEIYEYAEYSLIPRYNRKGKRVFPASSKLTRLEEVGIGSSYFPGYGGGENFFEDLPGYKPWFGILSDTTGCTLLFYYPKYPQPADSIRIPITGFSRCKWVNWTHGEPGLGPWLNFIFSDWLLAIHSE